MKEQLLGDGAKFKSGMKIWTSTYVEFNPNCGTFLDDYDLLEPYEKDTTGYEPIWFDGCTNSDGNKIQGQWLLYSISLTLLFSSRESSILHGVLNVFTVKSLLRKYKEDYLIGEFRHFIPDFTLEHLLPKSL